MSVDAAPTCGVLGGDRRADGSVGGGSILKEMPAALLLSGGHLNPIQSCGLWLAAAADCWNRQPALPSGKRRYIIKYVIKTQTLRRRLTDPGHEEQSYREQQIVGI